MDCSTSDEFVGSVSSSSKTVRPAFHGSDLVRHEELGSHTDVMEVTTKFVTLEHLKQRPTTTNNALESNRSNVVQDGRLEKYKSRQAECRQAECRAIFQNIEHVLCKQLRQLQLTLFDANNLESRLQELPKEATETSLLLAVCALTSSLAGVGHILSGNIAMMDGAKNPSNFTKMKSSGDSPQLAPASPALSISTVSEAENSSDLLLDYTPSNKDIAKFTNNAQSSNSDPFIAPQDAGASIQAPSNTMRLEYHSDFINLFGRRLYAPTPMIKPAAERSRRVILRNLPPSAELPQIIRGIQTHGQILRISLFNALPFANDATKTVMVEFVSPRPASELIRIIQTTPLVYEDEDRNEYQADAWLVPTASFGLSSVDLGVRSERYTRSLLLKGFPSDYIWYFIDKVGLQHIIRVERDATNDSLCIELTSIWQARRVDELICNGKFSDIYKYCNEEGTFRLIIPDMTQISSHIARPSGIIKHLPEDDLEKYWNTHPYNRLAPHTDCRIMTGAADTKLLMANTPHEPDWDESNRGEIDTWEQYGLLAKHRRQKAAEQGLDEAAIPECKEGCEMGCQDIKETPVADVVKNFLSRRSED